MKRTIYIIYNVVCQIVCLWLILYLGVYINGKFIPNSLMWKGNKPRIDLTGLISVAAIQGILLLIEACVFITLIYVLNKAVLRARKDGSEILTVSRTAKINVVVSFIFIVLLIISSLKQ